MIAVAGTIPQADFPLTAGPVSLQNRKLYLDGHTIDINRGTPALLAATCMTCAERGLDPPTAFLVGDTGLGKGSRTLYAWMEAQLPRLQFNVLCFHYLQPDVDWQYRVLTAAESMSSRPILVADAGFMYAAKMGGQADEYDLFTPDVGELAFLADEEAPHPFYTRGFILHEEQKVPDLIERACFHDNAAQYLLIKGRKDYVVHRGRILERIDAPVTEALEAIGGTGDTLTGIVIALIASGLSIAEAAVLAAHTNRWAGHLADPTPAGQVLDIIEHIPAGLSKAMEITHASGMT